MKKLIARLTKGRSADLLDGETIEAAVVAIWSGYFSGLFAGLAFPMMVAPRSIVAFGIGAAVGGGGGIAIAVWQRRSQLKSAATSTLAGRFPVFAFLAVTSRGDLVVWRQTGGGKVGELTVRCRVTDITSVATVRRLLFKRWQIGFIDGSDHVITRPGARDRTAFEQALARHGYTD
jgi:hypothetical protein